MYDLSESLSATIYDLPPDVWLLLVTQYLSDVEASMIAILNRTFYELMKDNVYRAIDFSNLNPSKYMEKIMLLQSPSNSTLRVRTIRVVPDVTMKAIAAIPAPPKFSTKLKSFMRHALRWPHANSESSLTSSMTQREREEAVIQAAKNLINVRDLDIKDISNPTYCPLIKTLLPLVSANLYSLSLSTEVHILRLILESLPCLYNIPNLREFRLVITPDLDPIGDSVRSFLQSLPLTLENLCFQLNISDQPRRMFISNFLPRCLDAFPEFQSNLTSLTLVIPTEFQRSHFHRISVYSFLRKRTPSLRELIIKSTPWTGYQSPLTSDWDWHCECLDDIRLDELDTLVLQGGHLPISRDEECEWTLDYPFVVKKEMGKETVQRLAATKSDLLKILSLDVEVIDMTLVRLIVKELSDLHRSILRKAVLI